MIHILTCGTSLLTNHDFWNRCGIEFLAGQIIPPKVIASALGLEEFNLKDSNEMSKWADQLKLVEFELPKVKFLSAELTSLFSAPLGGETLPEHMVLLASDTTDQIGLAAAMIHAKILTANGGEIRYAANPEALSANLENLPEKGRLVQVVLQEGLDPTKPKNFATGIGSIAGTLSQLMRLKRIWAFHLSGGFKASIPAITHVLGVARTCGQDVFAQVCFDAALDTENSGILVPILGFIERDLKAAQRTKKAQPLGTFLHDTPGMLEAVELMFRAPRQPNLEE